MEYSLSLTKECETKPIDEESDDYQHLSPAAILRGEQETLRVLLLDVGKHRLDEEDGRYEYVPIRMARPYSEGLFISRLSPPSDDREIVRVPGFVLEMETLEYEYQRSIRSRFLTFWDKALTVTVDVRDYKFLQAMVGAYLQHYNTAVHEVHQEAKTMRETAKRAANEQNGRGRGKGATGRLDLLQPPVQSTPGEASGRVKFQLPQVKGATEEEEKLTGGRRGLKGLFQRRPHSPIQLYVKDEEKEGSGAMGQGAQGGLGGVREEMGGMEEKKEMEVGGKDEKTVGMGRGDMKEGATVQGSEWGSDDSGGGGASEKSIDVMGVVEFNPQIHVLDNTSSGVSSRRVLELLGMKGDLSVIPQSTHHLTMVMDALMEACRHCSRTIDTALDSTDRS